MADIRQVDSDGKEVASSSPQSIPSSVKEMDNFDYDGLALSQVLGLDNDSERSKYKDDLQIIKEWAKTKEYKDSYELKTMVRNLINKMGTPAMAESLVTRVSRYAYLQLQTDKIVKEQESLLR